MRPGLARWLAPVGASAAVLVTVALPALVAAHTGARGGGPAPNRAVNRPIGPDLLVAPSPLPSDRRDGGSTRAVQITGYQGAGSDLTVFYRVGPRSDCSTAVRQPVVTEEKGSVAIRLVRAPPTRPEEMCEGLPLSSSVEIRLDRPVGGRVVRDTARRGALVQPTRPFH